MFRTSQPQFSVREDEGGFTVTVSFPPGLLGHRRPVVGRTMPTLEGAVQAALTHPSLASNLASALGRGTPLRSFYPAGSKPDVWRD